MLLYKNIVLICIFLFLGYFVNGQVFLSTKDFQNSIWAAKNENFGFYKDDTITLVRVAKNIEEKEQFRPDLANYFDNKNYIVLGFKEKQDLELSETNVKDWSIVTKVGKYKWLFQKRGQKLNFFFNSKSIGSFRIVSKKQTAIKSGFTYIQPKSTYEILLIRCKP
ncbi:hypothetical protein [Ferruginibacter sp. HRS2-29]|uniref:hypothetical protein n=1 Tax=Ferruginibacter sp. HRS2-29 TaxID=2487334 RepID=UPI0020CB6AFD|nr:hypothetical protein [Ferruginibacter sp. HRS2-29]MCP9749475.1 hypothetical protein [Ferruginibacter sp. HRS2-29]